MEFFPPDEFNRDWETVVRSMGVQYVAWQGNQCVHYLPFSKGELVLILPCRKYTGENLPAIAQTLSFDDFSLDAEAVVRSIREEINRVAAE